MTKVKEIFDRLQATNSKLEKNDDGGYGLRFPVWTHRVREDKTEISMN